MRLQPVVANSQEALMSPEALITFVGLVLAALAIVSPARLLDIRIRLHTLDWVVIWAAVLAVHYITFFDVLWALGLAPDLGPWRWGFSPETASYAILIASIAAVGLRIRTASLPRRKVGLFQEQVERMYFSRDFSGLLFLFERNFESLLRAQQNDYPSQRLRRLLQPTHIDLLRQIQHDRPVPVLQRLPDRIRNLITHALPSYDDSRDAAHRVFARLLQSDDLVSVLAQIRPYLALTLLSQKSLPGLEDFQRLWLTDLLKHADSALSYELRSTQSTDAGGRYNISSDSRILNFYLRPAATAERLDVYKPVGDYVLAELDARRDHPDSDRYLQALRDFHEEERFRDPIYLAFHFFDVMVIEALFQNVHWHMWLYYFEAFAGRIVRNVEAATDLDDFAEWPTPYHYFLYECVSKPCHWVRTAVDGVDPAQKNVRLDSPGIAHENGNIPKSAALCVGVVLRHILTAPHISDRFKLYCLEIPIRLARDLTIRREVRSPYAEVLLRAIVAGSPMSPREGHAAVVHDLYLRLDPVLQIELDSLMTPIFDGFR